jgi:hypothetical protein
MAQWDPKILGIISTGVSRGIEVVDFRKHWGIDPRNHTPEQLQRMTDPLGRGSKWLVSLSGDAKFEMIRQVIEMNGASVSLAGQPRIYRSNVQRTAVGMSNGRLVASFEVRFDGRRYAHAYPCDP